MAAFTTVYCQELDTARVNGRAVADVVLPPEADAAPGDALILNSHLHPVWGAVGGTSYSPDTLFVSSLHGSDMTGNGSFSAPFASITAAFAPAASATLPVTIVILDGAIYSEALVVNFSVPLTIIAESATLSYSGEATASLIMHSTCEVRFAAISGISTGGIAIATDAANAVVKCSAEIVGDVQNTGSGTLFLSSPIMTGTVWNLGTGKTVNGLLTPPSSFTGVVQPPYMAQPSTVTWSQTSASQLITNGAQAIIWDTPVAGGTQGTFGGLDLQGDGITFENTDNFAHTFLVSFTVFIDDDGAAAAGSYFYELWLKVDSGLELSPPLGVTTALNVTTGSATALTGSALVHLERTGFFTRKSFTIQCSTNYPGAGSLGVKQDGSTRISIVQLS